jgi:chorismate dehydratase
MQSDLAKNHEIVFDIPSVCADKFIHKSCDIGLIPVAALMKSPSAQIITPYCIAANGAVASVLLLSEVPLHEINTVLLDYQSRTSVMLAQVLAKEFWKVNLNWKPSAPDYEKEIKGNTAGVVIGDRAMLLKNHFKYQYDLSLEWKKYTGLPFVFACWASNTKISELFLNDFSDALNQGLNQKKALSLALQPHYPFDVYDYLSNHIDFYWSDENIKGLNLFLKLTGMNAFNFRMDSIKP